MSSELAGLAGACMPYMTPKHSYAVHGYIRMFESKLKLSNIVPLILINFIQMLMYSTHVVPVMISKIISPSQIKPPMTQQQVLHHMTVFLDYQSSWTSEWFYWISHDQFLTFIISQLNHSQQIMNIKSILKILCQLQTQQTKNNRTNVYSCINKHAIEQIIHKLIKNWTDTDILYHCILIIAHISGYKFDTYTRMKILNDTILDDIWIALPRALKLQSNTHKVSLNILQNTALMISNLSLKLEHYAVLNETKQKLLMYFFEFILIRMIQHLHTNDTDEINMVDNTLNSLFKYIKRIYQNHSYIIQGSSLFWSQMSSVRILQALLQWIQYKTSQNIRNDGINTLNYIFNGHTSFFFMTKERNEIIDKLIHLKLLQKIKALFYASFNNINTRYETNSLLLLLANIAICDTNKITTFKNDHDLLTIISYGIFSINKEIFTLTEKCIPNTKELRDHIILFLTRINIIQNRNNEMTINRFLLQKYGLDRKETIIKHYIISKQYQTELIIPRFQQTTNDIMNLIDPEHMFETMDDKCFKSTEF